MLTTLIVIKIRRGDIVTEYDRMRFTSGQFAFEFPHTLARIMYDENPDEAIVHVYPPVEE